MTLFTPFGWKFNNICKIPVTKVQGKRKTSNAAKFSLQNEVPMYHIKGLFRSLIDNVIMGLVIKMITNDNKGS